MNITTTAEESVTLLEIWTFCDIRISTLENVCSPLNMNQLELTDAWYRIYTVHTKQKVKEKRIRTDGEKQVCSREEQKGSETYCDYLRTWHTSLI